MAESLSGIYKTECYLRQESWNTAREIELATSSWAARYNTVRPHSSLDGRTSIESESAYYRGELLELGDQPEDGADRHQAGRDRGAPRPGRVVLAMDRGQAGAAPDRMGRPGAVDSRHVGQGPGLRQDLRVPAARSTARSSPRRPRFESPAHPRRPHIKQNRTDPPASPRLHQVIAPGTLGRALARAGDTRGRAVHRGTPDLGGRTRGSAASAP